MLPEKIAFVDIETTGGRSVYDRILEIGVLRVENNEIVDTYQTLINPNRYIPPEITLLTGITGKDVEDAPMFYEVSDRLQEILDGAIFVAHNVRFDYGFIKAEFGRMNIPFAPKHFCTVRLSRSLFPQHRHHNLDSIIERFGFSVENRHRAFDDAEILWKFYSTLQKTVDPEVLLAAVNKALKKPSMPVKLKQELLDSLPETPGVYIFYGPHEIEEKKKTGDQLSIDSLLHRTEQSEGDRLLDKGKSEGQDEGTVIGVQKDVSENSTSVPHPTPLPEGEGTSTHVPLYVGKSINIKERVLSHFAADIRNSQEMKISQQIEHIETHQTAGELGALFLESHLIKTMLPIYNKMLRLKRELVVLKKKVDKNGYFTADIDICSSDDLKISSGSFPLPSGEGQGEGLSFFDSFLGIFKTKRQAKSVLADIAKEHSLCEKLLGVESTLSSCFGYRLGRCNGACTGEEAAIKYNMRFVEAFANRKIRSWPFSGPIVITERNEYTGITDAFIVDQWCYVGKLAHEGDIMDEEIEQDITFDLDTYKILVRFMLNPRNIKKIRLLKGEETSALTSYAFS